MIATSLGDFAQAEVLHGQALALGRQAGWRLTEGTAHFNLGQCALAGADVAAALACADAAFEVARQIEQRTIMARSFLLRADACEAAGDRPAALAAFEEGRTRFEAIDAAPHVAITSVLIADHCRLAGDLPRAAPQLEALHADLQATVARIADAATRQAFLDNVQAHREIVAAWAAQVAPG